MLVVLTGGCGLSLKYPDENNAKQSLPAIKRFMLGDSLAFRRFPIIVLVFTNALELGGTVTVFVLVFPPLSVVEVASLRAAFLASVEHARFDRWHLVIG